ncbi:MAG: NAD(+) synthase [Clostridia bacterium]|nr:NAD(+) synthase [Clostridia bacterium]
MKDGFVKVKCVSPEIRLGSPGYNGELIIKEIKKADKAGVNVLVFPELVLCGYTLRDMAGSPAIVNGCHSALGKILEDTKKTSVIAYVGMPVRNGGKLYNTVTVIQGGEVIGIVPKSTLPKASPFGEDRVFTPANEGECRYASLNLTNDEEMMPVFSPDLIVKWDGNEAVSIGCVVGDDVRAVSRLTSLGATIIVNPTAIPTTVTSAKNARLIAEARSKEYICGYALCNASERESTTDALFTPYNMICENGDVLTESIPFKSKTGDCVSEIDVNYLVFKRQRAGFAADLEGARLRAVRFVEFKSVNTALSRVIDTHPFILKDGGEMDERCETILTIQAHALARRIEASYSKTAVIGISGGLDSTLALLVMVRAFDYLKMDRKDIIAVTMPCFGTTKRTKSNAIDLCNALGVTLREINIFEATRVHLRDICHDEANKNVTYENAQARERTQILMDIANDTSGLVVGTGDLSEVALGWATYNGDHMSMYNVNGDIPKTLVRYVVSYFAKSSTKKIKAVLNDILDTPVSPELLPANEKDEIQQKTEDLVGPYDLHDFFLYNFISRGYTPSKLHRTAVYAFDGKFDKETIYKWLKVFLRRFVTQQF